MNWTNQFARRTGKMRRTAVRELLKVTAQPGMISFAGGLPAPECFPVEEIKRATQTVLVECGAQALQYGETEGIAGLRDWIAGRFSRPNRRMTRRNVVIVSGAQQGLDLIGRVMLDSGDAVLVENPTYLALLSAWRPLGVCFVPVQSDADGMCVQTLDSRRLRKPKLIYVVPNFQNPQGTTLSSNRRLELVQWLQRHGVALVEDDPYGELRYEGEPISPIFDLQGGAAGPDGGQVLYVGTFSKVLAPGLRIGWVIGPEEAIAKIVQAKQAADLHTSTFCQHLVLNLARNNVLNEHLPNLISAYRERRDAMLASMEKHFPAGVSWTRPNGGMFLMVTLPKFLDAGKLLARSLERRVAFVPGEEFHLRGACRNTFRLNFSNTAPPVIEDGIGRLGTLLKDAVRENRDD